VDFIFDRKNYDPHKILNTNKRIDPLSIIIWFIGFLVYILLAAPSLIHGLYIPIFTEVGSMLGSSIPTLIIVSLLYAIYVLYRR